MAWAQFVERPRAGWAACLDLLFPPRCSFCLDDIPATSAHPSDRPGSLCADCFRELTADSGRCMRCGGSHGHGQACRGGRHAADWEGIAVLGGYADPIREAVLRCKRPAGDPLARALGESIVAMYGEALAAWGIDCVVPVPMHWSRRALRGTSAAETLAQAVAALLGVRCCPALRRCRATRMQNELPVAARRANVSEAFALRRPVAGSRVLLVDDVCTTGSTLAACRRMLCEGQAAAVYAAVVARAEPGHGATDHSPTDAHDA